VTTGLPARTYRLWHNRPGVFQNICWNTRPLNRHPMMCAFRPRPLFRETVPAQLELRSYTGIRPYFSVTERVVIPRSAPISSFRCGPDRGSNYRAPRRGSIVTPRYPTRFLTMMPGGLSAKILSVPESAGFISFRRSECLRGLRLNRRVAAPIQQQRLNCREANRPAFKLRHIRR